MDEIGLLINQAIALKTDAKVNAFMKSAPLQKEAGCGAASVAAALRCVESVRYAAWGSMGTSWSPVVWLAV
jgi:hypothetical protein